MKVIKYHIKERSFFAKLAALKLGSTSVAMVIGKTIHLHNVSKAEFRTNEKWLRHEQCHIRQCKELGLAKFLALYILESIKKGYHNNKFEVEARAAEEDDGLLEYKKSSRQKKAMSYEL